MNHLTPASGGFRGIKAGRDYPGSHELVEPAFDGFTRCTDEEKNAVKDLVLRSCT